MCCQRQHVAGVEASESNPGGTPGGLVLVAASEIQTAEARLVHRLSDGAFGNRSVKCYHGSLRYLGEGGTYVMAGAGTDLDR